MPCISDRFLCISSADVFMCTDIVFFFVKNLWCIRCSRLCGRMHMRKYFVLYLDKLHSLFCRFTVFGRHQCNRIAKIMHKTANRDQRILVMLQMTDFIFSRNIFCCHHCFHTRKSFCFRRVNGKNPCTCIFTSESHAVKHSIQIIIIRIFSITQNFLFYIDPCYAVSKCPVRISIIRKLT